MAVDDILLECEEHMEKAIEHLKHEFRSVRTGRASPALVENIKIEYYGSLTDLRSIASITVPEAMQLLIKPFSPGDLKAIEKAIGESKIGLTPHSDGKQLRINLPALSQERRLQLAGQVKQMSETAKIGVRNARRDANKNIEAMAKELREDDVTSAKEQVQELTKKYEADIDKHTEHKRQELLTV